jgi:hypothetical protein
MLFIMLLMTECQMGLEYLSLNLTVHQLSEQRTEEGRNRAVTWTEFLCSIVKLRSSLILGALYETALRTVSSSLAVMNLNFSWKH